MSVYQKPDASEDAATGRKPLSTMQIMLLILGGLILSTIAIERLSSNSILAVPADGSAPITIEAPSTGSAVTLASALNNYKIADASCEKAALGIERNTGTVESALEACGDSLRAVSDLPAFYGPPAEALQSCIDMEGARFSGLEMVSAMREHRGDFEVVMDHEVMYRKKFHIAAIACNSDLVTIHRAIEATP